MAQHTVPLTFTDRLTATARERPQDTFLVMASASAQQPRELTYRDALARIGQYCGALTEIGIKHGDAVGLALKNSPDWLLLYLALQQLGAITVGLDPTWHATELIGPIEDANVRLLVTEAERVEPLRRAVADRATEVIGLDGDDSLRARAQTHDTRVPAHPLTDTNEIVLVMLTSGTTGARPKCVAHTLASLVPPIASYQDRIGLRPDDRLFICTPLFHGCALYYASALAILSGASIAIAEKFSASAFWRQVKESGSTIVWTMGAVITLLLQRPQSELEQQVSGSLRFIFATGSGPRRAEAVRRWGRPVFDGYGMTEIPGTLTMSDPPDANETHPSVGSAVDGVELRITDPDTGQPTPTGQIGEIVVDASVCAIGYLAAPEATAATIRDGWFHTGDRGFLDESGELHFVDRIKDIIRRGGENISAVEVENVLLGMPGVAEAIALAAPDPAYGETVCAVIVPRADASPPSLDEVQQYCSDRLAKYKWPTRVVVLESGQIPRTPTGKIRKPQLRQAIGTSGPSGAR